MPLNFKNHKKVKNIKNKPKTYPSQINFKYY